MSNHFTAHNCTEGNRWAHVSVSDFGSAMGPDTNSAPQLTHAVRLMS